MAEGDARAGGELTSRGRIHDVAARGYEAGVEHYRRGRPPYPDDAVTYLVHQLRIRPGSDALELGAGTGRFTELIVHTGAAITAVEPPRRCASLSKPAPPPWSSTGGREIPVADGSADAVVARRFHWFDGERSRTSTASCAPAGASG
jgi:hypothetical protein